MFSLTLPKRGERGFTLIELLVVIIIIGILAAIAIPLFLDQRKLAVDASVKSDVRNTATQVQTWLATNPGAIATDATDYTSKGGKVASSTGDTVNLSVATDGSYLVCGYGGTAAKNYTAASAAYVYDSTSGKFGLGSCTGGIVGGSASSSSTAAATPTASFTNTVNAQTVSLDASASTNVTGTTPYTWNYGDGTASESKTAATTSHTYTTGGTYTVILTVKNGDGGPTKSISQSIAVASPPVVTYNAEDGTTTGFNPGSGHTVSVVTSPVHGGTKSVNISGYSTYAGMGSLDQAGGLVKNTNYTITGWVYITNGGSLYLAKDSDGSSPSATVNTKNAWVQITTTVNTGNSTYLPAMTFFRPAYTSMNVYFDDFTVTKA